MSSNQAKGIKMIQNLIKNSTNKNIVKQIILGSLFSIYILLFSHITSNFEKIFLFFTLVIVSNEYFNIICIKKIKVFILTLLSTILLFTALITFIDFCRGFINNIEVFKFIYKIILLFIVLYIIKSSKLGEGEEEGEDGDELSSKYLFSYKKNELNILNERINDKDIPSILIDQKIGTGKSTLIDHYIKNIENNVEVVYIKLPLIENIANFKRIIFQEIQIIFKKNKISSPYLKNLLKYFSNIKISNFEFSLNKKTTTLWDDLKELKIGLLKLENKSKKILIVIDDIERVQDTNLIKDSISFIGEVGEYFRGTSTTILYLADKEEIEARIKKMNDNYKINFLDKYFMSNLKMNSPVIGNLSEEDIDILIDEMLLEEKFNNDNTQKYHSAMISILNEAHQLNNLHLKKISELKIKKNKISSEIDSSEVTYKLNEASGLVNNDTYITILKLKQERNEVIAELDKINKFYKEFESNNNLRNIKRFLKKTSSISTLKCYNGINIALFSILYFTEVFYPTYHYSVKNKIDYMEQIEKDSDTYNYFYTKIVNIYSYNSGSIHSNHYYNIFNEKSLLIFDFYSSNKLEKEHLTIGDKILLNIFENVKLEEKDLENLNTVNINYIFRELNENFQEIFFENKFYLEQLFLEDKNLMKIINFLNSDETPISKSSLENIILFLEGKIKNGYFIPPKKHYFKKFIETKDQEIETKEEIELNNIKAILEKTIEQNHSFSNLFLEKINLIIQYSVKNKEEEKEEI